MTLIRTPNSEQQLVINDIQNNIILFASAGTGKTFTVANRINNILEHNLAKPEEILCLTFTNKACNEMREDIAQYVGLSAKKINIRTIHSFCLSLLKTEAKKRNDMYTDIDVCDEVDEADILQRIMSEYGAGWVLEDSLAESGIETTISELYTCDVLYDDIHMHQLCWILDRGNSVYSIYPDGQFSCFNGSLDMFQKTIVTKSPTSQLGLFRCPYCKAETTSPIINLCNECGYDFRQMLPIFDTPILRETPKKLRDIVTVIKKYRYHQSLYSGDEITDFQDAIQYLYNNGKLSEMFTFYSRVTRNNIEDSELEAFFIKHGGKFLHAYCAFLKQSNFLDYDDLIIEAAHLLKEPMAKAYWDKQFKFITVDEMQDTSEIEYEALDQLFGENNIMLCGDFFQTIYKWRGSNPEVILNKYIKDNHAVSYMFRENYRSTKMLANASFGYLKNTYPELVGAYCPPELGIHSREVGSKIQHYSFENISEEAEFVFNYIRENLPEDPTSICIMARTNPYIADFADCFDMFNKSLPDDKKLRYFTVERNQAFYKTPVIKDLLAFLRVLLNKTDSISMDRIAQRFISGVGVKTIEQLHNYNHLGVNICAFLNPDTYAYGDNYHTLINAAMSGNIVVYDTETTGLDLSKDQVIQIAAARYDMFGNIVDTFNEIVIPTVEVSQGARDTIPFDVDKEIKERGIPAKKAFTEFAAFVKGTVLVGHNSDKYDSPLIARQLTELGLPELEIQGEYDTLLLSKQYYSKLPNYKLSTLCDYFNVVNEDAHNALGDVKATGAVLFEVIRNGLLSSQEERIQILNKYSNRFKAFFDYEQSLEKILAAGNVYELVENIISTSHLESKYKTITASNAIHDIKNLIKETPYEDAQTFVQDFVCNATMSGSQMDNLIKKLKQIPMITVHQSKGCEFDTVIMVGVHDSQYPTFASKKQGDTEEEKRVFYVAISRAKRKLIMTYPSWEGGWDRDPSPYTSNIPRQYINFH